MQYEGEQQVQSQGYFNQMENAVMGGGQAMVGGFASAGNAITGTVNDIGGMIAEKKSNTLSEA